ncbi:DUF6691 family protein [uncultured Rhodoblastus sp.]|uniref:DUF6691 family protein n=1 Tax=uncultured Rhodoblastus sp. TaxID=543037 RepID=UPI0025D9096F|nr:DUF6691 family protein [uncultured Rhodoblastus sp.]
MAFLSPLVAGLIFGLGLCLSGMIDPAKVLAFLDLAGMWDPSLALVMGGAVTVAFIAFRIAGHRASSFAGRNFEIPKTRKIDAKLVGGAVIFGTGWGLAGLCPAPAIVNIGFLDPRAVLFVLAMLAGMKLGDVFSDSPTGEAESPAAKQAANSV